MIRRLFLISLALSAITMAAAGVRSCFVPLCLGASVSARHWTGIYFYDGRVRLFWIRSSAGTIHVTNSRERARLSIFEMLAESSP